MKLSNTFSTAGLLLVALFAQLQSEHATAFVVAPTASQGSRTTTKLYVSTIYSDFPDDKQPRRNPFANDRSSNNDDDVGSALTDFATPTAAAQTLSKLDMPKHGPSAQEIETAKTLMSLEMTVGRGAMMVAVLLMATELSTGASLPEQFSTFFS